jgi:hypothetical protein
MVAKKYLKKGKKGHKKNNLMRGGAKIKISGEQIKQIVENIFNNSIFIGETLTNVIIANAILEVLGGVVAGDELSQLSNLGINIIAVSLQFILTSLKLTLGVGSHVGSQLFSASSFVTNSLWSAVTSISNICSSNPTAAAVVATAVTTTVALKNQELKNIIQNVGNFGLIDSVSIMLFDLLIKSGMFEDSEGYNQLKLEDLKENQVDDIAGEIVNISRENTPENSPPSSQDSSQDSSQENEVAVTGDVVRLEYDEEARARLAQLLDDTLIAINDLSKNINYKELSYDFLEDADSSKICGKRKNVEENEENIQKTPRPTDDGYSPDYSSEEGSNDNKNAKGGKKTRHRKRKHNKNKTRKHKKTHTKKHKKHIKKHKKHTKKH